MASKEMPKRNMASMFLVLLKKNFDEVLDSIFTRKILRVKVLNEHNYSSSFRDLNQKLQFLLQKFSLVEKDIPKVNTSLFGIDKSLIDSSNKIGNILIQFKDEMQNKVKDSSSLSGEQLQQLNVQLLEAIGQLEEIKETIEKKEIKFPVIQKVAGRVEIASLPEIYKFEKIVKQLEEVKKAISEIKIEIPKTEYPRIEIPAIPKQLSMIEGKLILKALQQLADKINELPKTFPDITIPKTISIDNFPPQKYPMPVTHISINSLKGSIKSRNITVTTSLTPLPDEVLAYRRSIIVYNNDSSATLFVGGSDVTTTNGMPIPPRSYSPAFDAGQDMILYGISTGSINVRVLEVSDERSGR